MLTPDSAWSALELTPAVSKTSAALEASATTDEAAIRETLVALGLSPATLEPPRAARRGGSKTDAAVPSARERAQAWGEALLEVLLPLQPQPGTPVLLACDDTMIGRAGARLAVTDDPASVFAGDVTVAFSIGSRGLGRANAGRVRNAPRPRPLPEFFPRAVPARPGGVADGARRAPTHAYYLRLRDLLGVRGEGHIEDIEFVHSMFQCLADWLDHDLAGARGRLVPPKEPPTLRYVGTIVSQTVFRRRDRQVLTEFFTSRSGTFEHAAPLRRLRRGEMLHQLAPDAAELVHAMQRNGSPVRTTRPGISISRMYLNAAWNSLLRRSFFTLSGQRGRHPWSRDHLEQHPVRQGR